MENNDCTVIPQGQKVEYDLENNIVTFYFGLIPANNDVHCSLNGATFEPCKLNVYVLY